MNNNTRFYMIIAALLMLLFLQRSCNAIKVEKLQSKIGIMNVGNQEMRQQLNKNGDTITSQSAILIANKATLKQYADNEFALKKKMGATIAFYKNNVQTRIDTFEIAFVKHDTIPKYITDDFARQNMIFVPVGFVADSPYYHLSGVVKKSGIVINDIVINDSVTGRFVENKKKLFRPVNVQVQLMNTNPNVYITGMQSLVYQPKKKSFFKKVANTALLVGAGVITGIIISK